MFDKYIVTPRPVEHHTHVKQLPHDTADAARLYGEMVEKARAEVLGATIREAGAKMRVVVSSLQVETNFENYDTEVRVMFAVNGVNYDIKTKADRMDCDVREAVARHVTAEVMVALEKRNGRIR